MEVINKMLEYVEDEIEGAKDYAEFAVLKKTECPDIAKIAYDLSNIESSHADIWYKQIESYIVRTDAPNSTKAIYDYIKKQQIEEMNEIKMLQEQYNR